MAAAVALRGAPALDRGGAVAPPQRLIEAAQSRR
jgi:hypothetical protein